MNYELINLYAGFLKKFLNPKRSLRVVFDCSNGTAGIILKKLFLKPKISARGGSSSGGKNQNPKLRIFLINDDPDGNFPAHGPNPMKKNALRDLSLAVRRHKADLGVIFDADGDRVFFVDDNGRMIHPDISTILISQNFKGPVVLTVQMGYLPRETIAAAEKKIIDSRVGHYFVKKIMRKEKAVFGAEPSGHYFFKDFFFCDSGIFAAIQFINAVSRLDSNLSQWIDNLPKYFRSGELNFKAGDKEGILRKVEAKYRKQADKVSYLDGLKMEFNPPAGGWWFNLRPSNTEDLVRLILEAKDYKIFKSKLKEIKNLLN